MFDRVSRDVLIRLKEVLKQLLPSNFNYLVPICCDNMGKLLEESCMSPGLYRQSVKHTHLIGKQATLQTCRELYKSSSTVSNLLGYCYRQDLTEVIDLLLDTSKELMKLMPLSANTKKAIPLVLPYNELHLMSNVIAHLSLTGQRDILKHCLFSDRWNARCSQSDYFSAKLKQTPFLHRTGYYKASIKVIVSVIYSKGRIILSKCSCRSETLH